MVSDSTNYLLVTMQL